MVTDNGKHVLLVRTKGLGDFAYLIGEGEYDDVMTDYTKLGDQLTAYKRFVAGAPYDDDEEWEARYANDHADFDTLGDEVSLEDISWYAVFRADEIVLP